VVEAGMIGIIGEIVGLVHERVLRAGGDPVELRIRGGWERAALERR